MTYEQTLDWLYSQLPAYERDGNGGYKPGLQQITDLCAAFGSPEKHLKCIHVAGTNGKGSTASTLAAIFQSAGLKTALYTSPHLRDFRERMRINGEMIPRERVTDFIERYQALGLPMRPSFFELTTAMAFEWFDAENVDIAIIEVGLGGRLDSTNIINPEVSVITNISLDHTSLLGETVAEIAFEKAGIIKEGVPVVCGPMPDPAVRQVIERQAAAKHTTVEFCSPLEGIKSPRGGWDYPADGLHGALEGEFQRENMAVVLGVMRRFPGIPQEAIRQGFEQVESLTGLRGRFTRSALPDGRTLIYDTGHNPGAWACLGRELAAMPNLVMLIGFAADKDVSSILRMMPRHAQYVFTQPDSHRALPAEELQRLAATCGLQGLAIPIYAAARAHADAITTPGATLFIGGSNYLPV